MYLPKYAYVKTHTHMIIYVKASAPKEQSSANPTHTLDTPLCQDVAGTQSMNIKQIISATSNSCPWGT